MTERLDQIERILAQTAQQQQANTEAIARIDERLDRISEQQQAMTRQQQAHTEAIARIDERLDRLTENVDRLAQGFDSLVFETQRVVGQGADRLTRLEATTEFLVDAVTRLTQSNQVMSRNIDALTRNMEAAERRAEADRAEFRAEIQRIWQYLMRQYPNGGSAGAS